jgi:hypothetical protein
VKTRSDPVVSTFAGRGRRVGETGAHRAECDKSMGWGRWGAMAEEMTIPQTREHAATKLLGREQR